MKQIIRKEALRQVLYVYLNKISEHFLHQPLTPSTLYRMDDFLKYLQHQKKYTETAIEWQVPIVIKQVGVGEIVLEPILDNYELLEEEQKINNV